MCKSASTTVTMPIMQSLPKDCTSCCGMRDARGGNSQTNSERVEEADDGVDVTLQEEALEGIEDVLVLVLEIRDAIPDEGSGGGRRGVGGGGDSWWRILGTRASAVKGGVHDIIDVVGRGGNEGVDAWLVVVSLRRACRRST
nr:unnamed protein product [Digitaria exilis]